MVINAPIEYYHAKKKFDEAKTPEEKLEALKEMLKHAPKHKGAQNLLVWITKEIAKYKEMLEKKKRQKKGRSKPLIEKNGDILISILGSPNSGKSTLLKYLTNVNIEISEIPYTTIKPITGTTKYRGIYYQFVEIPATFETKFREILSISDFYIVILDPNKEIGKQLDDINEFSLGIYPFSLENSEKHVVLYKKDLFNYLDKEDLLESIIKKLNKIRVFPINSDHAVLLNYESTIREFIKKLNGRWINKFRYAIVYRNKNKIRAGLNYKLCDLDVVELKLK